MALRQHHNQRSKKHKHTDGMHHDMSDILFQIIIVHNWKKNAAFPVAMETRVLNVVFIF